MRLGRTVAAVAAVLAAVSAGAVAAPAARAQAVPPRVLVYGDSLSWEAQAGIEQAIEAQLPGYDAIVRTSPGTATCNALPQMRADGNLNAAVVVIEFVAVSLGPCMAGRDQLTQHAADTQAAMALWASRGVPVILVAAPRIVGEPRELSPIGALNRNLAAAAGQTFVDAGVLLRDPWTGVYQQRLPCLAGEGPAQGCGLDGLIDVRDDTGSHFCAIHNVGPCPVYASGIVRFAAPIADAVARVAGTARAPLPGPPTDGETQSVVRAVLGGVDGAITPSPPETPTVDATTRTDHEIAASAVLTDDVVQRDFAPARTTKDNANVVPAIEDRSCRAIRRALTPLQRGARAEASFAAPGDSATIDQVVYVAQTERRARQAYAAYAGPDASTCLTRIFGVAVSFEQPRDVGDASIRYHVDAERDFVLEFTVAGRTVNALAFTNAVTPPAADAVDAITKAAIARADAALLAGPLR